MASRFGNSSSSLHQRDPRSSLFGNYDSGVPRASPAPGGYGYNSNGGAGTNGSLGAPSGGYRPATPNSRGQYSDSTLNELESQNDGQVEGILGKVRMLKGMTVAIGDEIRASSSLAETMNDSFDKAGGLLRGTHRRMMVMAQKTGIPWRVWVGFFAAVCLLFWYVWLF